MVLLYLKSSSSDPSLTTVPSIDTLNVLSGLITVMYKKNHKSVSLKKKRNLNYNELNKLK